MWTQAYDPAGSTLVSCFMAGIPVLALLLGIGFLRVGIHKIALAALSLALLVAIAAIGMPAGLAFRAAGYGMLFGLMPIGWIVLNMIFFYRMTVYSGSFTVLQDSIAGITPDRRIQILLIPFAFGAFFEGVGGFGAPVAISAAIMIGLGFSPMAAAVLSLIGNTAPVGFGSLGIPTITLAAVTGLDLQHLSAMIGRQLPVFAAITPFWLVWVFAGLRPMLSIWPAALTAGVSFAIPQFLISNYVGPTLVDTISALASLGGVVVLLRFWQPGEIWTNGALLGLPCADSSEPRTIRKHNASELARAWMPWLILTGVLFIWGFPATRAILDGIWTTTFPIAGLDRLVLKVPPAAARPLPEPAIWSFNILSMTGSGILAATFLSSIVERTSPVVLFKEYGKTFWSLKYSLLTISAMLGIGFTTRFAGMDTILGLGFAGTGALYPFFGTIIGWLGVALTGSDAASNALFGSLQRTTATNIGLSPILMSAANASGGVMGKMIDAQSIVVASTASDWTGHERSILRTVLPHSIALAALVAVLVLLQAHVYPFSLMVVAP
jgi:lactate permease